MDAPQPFWNDRLNATLEYWWNEFKPERSDLEVTSENVWLHTTPVDGISIHGMWSYRQSVAPGDYHGACAIHILEQVEQNVSGEASVALRAGNIEGILIGTDPSERGGLYVLQWARLPHIADFPVAGEALGLRSATRKFREFIEAGAGSTSTPHNQYALR